MCILDDYSNFRQNVKKQICDIATEIYKTNNDELLPNWEDDEEIVIYGSDANNYKISIIVGNTYDNTFTTERQEIDKIRVTLDSNLFFTTGECANEINWSEVSTDELVDICHYLQKTYENL
jgi:hypothetical protein